jgi:prepilin-type N-terminal cleavage/methylation domain-containing protein
MKSARTRLTRSGARGRRGFTLVEVLASLVFLAILLPVTVQAVRVASQAGQVGERKGTAARVAERVLNELIVTGGSRQNSAGGRIEERHRTYEWTMRSDPWADSLNLVTVQVVYQVQGQNFDVTLSTLVDSAQEAGGP